MKAVLWVAASAHKRLQIWPRVIGVTETNGEEADMKKAAIKCPARGVPAVLKGLLMYYLKNTVVIGPVELHEIVMGGLWYAPDDDLGACPLIPQVASIRGAIVVGKHVVGCGVTKVSNMAICLLARYVTRRRQYSG